MQREKFLRVDVNRTGDRLEIAGGPLTESDCRYERNSESTLMSAST